MPSQPITLNSEAIAHMVYWTRLEKVMLSSVLRSRRAVEVNIATAEHPLRMSSRKRTHRRWMAQVPDGSMGRGYRKFQTN